MKRIRTSRELYCEILKSFYFGIYHKGDKFSTYKEIHEMYGLAKKTIGIAYTMLQKDWVISTNGANGTIVTFDINNPEHVAKVPIEYPQAIPQGNIPYDVAMHLHAHSLYTGLTHSSKEQLLTCKKIVEDILQRVKSGKAHYEQVFAFWMCAISALDNAFLNRITDHFISQYLYLLPPSHLCTEQQRLIGDSALKYYEFLLHAIDMHDFEEFPARFERHYRNYYRFGGLVFSKLEEGEVFKEQALYERLLEDLCFKILSGELQKNAPLPTTKHLCAQYGISTTTVNRAYGILAELGIITRRVGSGTTLISEPSTLEIWDALEESSGLQKQDWTDAIEALLIINDALCKRVIISADIMQKMRAELARQHKLLEDYSTPYSVSSVLLSPLISSLPTGILHKYYGQLTDVVSRVTALCTLRIRENEEHASEVYQLMCDALEALECGNHERFATLSGRAMYRNAELQVGDYAPIPTDTKKLKKSFK